MRLSMNKESLRKDLFLRYKGTERQIIAQWIIFQKK